MVQGFDKRYAIDMFGKTEHIALGIGQRIEPAPTLMEAALARGYACLMSRLVLSDYTAQF